MTNPVSRVFALAPQILTSSLFRAAGTYGFFSLINSAIPFFLLPVMTRYLTPDDYGIVAVFGVMVSLFMPFIGMNAHGAYSRAYFAPDRFDSAKYMGTVIVFSLATWVVACAIFGIFRTPFSALFTFPSEWMWAVPVVALGTLLPQIVQVSWQVREQPRSYGIFQNARTLSEVGGALLFVVLLGMGWQGRVLSRVFVSVLFACVGLYILVRKQWLVFSFDKTCLSHALCFGIPLIPHTLAGILNTSIDRLFITRMVGIADTGLYTVGYQIGTVIGLAATAFNQAYVPWLFRKLNMNSEQEKIKIVKFTYLYFFVIISAAIILGALAPFMMRVLVGVQFQGSSMYVVWIALGYAFSGAYYMVVNYIFYIEKTHLLAMVTFMGAIINIFFNYFFIRWNGAVGAAQATSLMHLLTFLFVWYLSSKVYPMPWRHALKRNTNP